jgi:polyhydroxyalkanoate synthesis regulator phasin
MVLEALQTYVNLVNGLTRAPRERARATARGLLAQVGLEEVADDAERRVGRFTEEIMSAGRANRELLENLVGGEVTKAASRWGFVRSDDLDEVREEIAELRAQLARQQAGTGTAAQRPAAADAKVGPMVPDPDADAGA